MYIWQQSNGGDSKDVIDMLYSYEKIPSFRSKFLSAKKVLTVSEEERNRLPIASITDTTKDFPTNLLIYMNTSDLLIMYSVYVILIYANIFLLRFY